MKIVAGCPVWKEHPLTVARARASVQAHIPFIEYEGGCGPHKQFPTQASMRQHGLTLAWRGLKADWYLQLDADERLRNAELLAPILEGWKVGAYPLPLLQEDGSLLLAPFKLMSTGWGATRIIACAEYVKFWPDGPIWCLAGYVAPEHLRDCLLRLPYIEHCPSDRPPARRLERLSEEEPWLEPRPEAVLEWVLPALTLQGGDVSEEKEGKYYCPGCGLRFKVPGICEGTPESGHEPINVEAVSSGPHELEAVAPETRSADTAPTPEAEQAPKRKPPRKKSTTSAKKKSTTARRKR